MKKVLVVFCCVFLWRTTTALGCPAEDSPLVKAAKANGGPKKKSKKKVITNADVKKAGGKITELPGSKATITLRTERQESPIAKQEEQRRATAIADKRVATAETKVANLESDLARIEQSYYESGDPSYRDTTIKARFEQTKKQLEDARKQLADAREEQKRVSPPPPVIVTPSPAKSQ